MSHATLFRPAASVPIVPDLASPVTRGWLTPAAIQAMVRLGDAWTLSTAEICVLMGDLSERTWFRMKKGDWTGSLSQDTLTRVSAIVGIFKGLHLLFSQPLADEWVRLPNSGSPYAGRRPLELMLTGGIPALLGVRRHIDSLRGGL